MILESIGVGVIIPVVNLLFDPNYYSNKLGSIGFQQNNLLKIVFFISILFFVFKFIYLTFLSLQQNKFISFFTHNIVSRLLESYLFKEYNFFTKKNSTEYVKNIFIETNYFSSFFTAFINLFVDLCFTVSLLFLLLYIEPIGAMFVIFLFLIGSFIIFRITKKRLVRWGEERKEIDRKLSKTTIEGFNAIKEIKVLGVENKFLSVFNINNNRKADIHYKHLFFSQLPKNFLEVITFIGLFVFLLIIYVSGNDIIKVITKLSVFVAASFKIITSLNRILSNYQQTKYYNASVDVIYDSLINHLPVNNVSNNHLGQFKNLTASNLSFKYSDKNILDKVAFEISRGDRVCFIGESGAGKSTLLDLLLGLQIKNSGELKINDIELDLNHIKSWQSKIGYVPQKIFLLDDSIANNILLGTKKYDDHWLNFLIDALNLRGVQLTLEKSGLTVGENGNNLSGGQVQRIIIARALYKKPEILILDEFTNNLDDKNEWEVLEILQKYFQETTIIFTTHKTSPLKIANKIYTVKNKQLILTKNA